MKFVSPSGTFRYSGKKASDDRVFRIHPPIVFVELSVGRRSVKPDQSGFPEIAGVAWDVFQRISDKHGQNLQTFAPGLFPVDQ
jgi:hypothetical protein